MDIYREREERKREREKERLISVLWWVLYEKCHLKNLKNAF